MTAAPSPSKKRSLLRKFLYLAAAAVLLGSLLLSYMQWEANTLRFRETQAPAGCLPGLSGLRILVLSDVHTGLPMLEEAVTCMGKSWAALLSRGRKPLIFHMEWLGCQW